MNKVVLMGRLTADPELKETNNGVKVCNFTLAVNRNFSKDGQQQTDFINCTAWSNTAEFLRKYFGKGSMVAIVGNIQVHYYENAEGKKLSKVAIIVEEVNFTGEKRREQNVENSKSDKTDELPDWGFSASDDEGLPFWN